METQLMQYPRDEITEQLAMEIQRKTSLRSESTERDRDSEECDDPDEEKRETKESERRQILDRQEDSEEWLTHTDGIVARSLAE